MIVAETVDLNNPQLIKRVDKVIVHDGWNVTDSFIHDIALLRIEDEFELSSVLGFVPLPRPHEVVPAGSPAVVSGWGVLSVSTRANRRTERKIEEFVVF